MAQGIQGNAAWLPNEKARNMEIASGPTHFPTENEVVIKVAYAAVNPVDHLTQDSPYKLLSYPFILGTDVAGTVVQVGSGLTRFKVGDRVIGHCDSLVTEKPTHSGFQEYATLLDLLVSPIPDSLPLANAAVLPISVSTAATALFKQLKLPFPTLDAKPSGKTILIWGGSSSVGSTAIQLAQAAGLQVATTASTHNHDYVAALGAKHVFDYNSASVIDDILKVLKPGDYVFDAMSYETTQNICAEIMNRIGGGAVAVVRWPNKSEYDDVDFKSVNSLDPGLVDFDLGDAIWRKFIPQALAAGKLQAKPDPYVLEGGLGRVQDGIALLKKGVSAKKIVIEIAKEE